MKLILISYPDFFPKETSIVCSLLKQYDFIFHLRKPVVEVAEYESFLQEIPMELHNRIVVHDAPELMDRFNLKGLHYSTKNRPAYLPDNKNVTYSTSCHSTHEIKEHDKCYDYAFLSPVFPSISKQDYNNVLDLNKIQDFLQKERDIEIIALGGINEYKIRLLESYAFDGMAVLGAVWTNVHNSKEIEDNFKKIYQCIQKDLIA